MEAGVIKSIRSEADKQKLMAAKTDKLAKLKDAIVKEVKPRQRNERLCQKCVSTGKSNTWRLSWRLLKTSCC